MPGLPYDLVADIPEIGLLRIQVKTTAQLKGRCYVFVMKRGCHRSKRRKFDYDQTDYDIAAFVSLPLARICFCATPVKRFTARPEWLQAAGIEQQTLTMAIRRYSAFRALGRPTNQPKFDVTRGRQMTMETFSIRTVRRGRGHHDRPI
jgi:hypothetical protein